uniref:Putative competence protein (ComEC) n=1 Tax=Leptospirillum ferrodiazotrophum TaxID=412449 RepID=C6HVF0_9BACT|nr:MAG: putative competence protein (ComEC) [Leptospirillum ferrodiazotrophum]
MSPVREILTPLVPRPLTVKDLFPASVILAGGLFLSSLARDFPLLLGALVSAPLIVSLLSGSRHLLPLLLWILSFFGGLLALPAENANPPLLTPAFFSLCLAEPPRSTTHGTLASLKNDGSSPDLPSSFRLFIPSDRLTGTLETGDCLSGVAIAPSHPSPPDLFGDSRPFYILSESFPMAVTRTLSPRGDLLRRLHHRQAELLTHLLSTFPRETAGLLSALLLSDTRFMTREEREDFTMAGVSHLLSVSGEHMTLLAFFFGGLVLLSLRLLPLPLLRRLLIHLPLGRLLPLTLLPLLLAYTLMIGAPEAADRAFLGFALAVILRFAFVDLDFPAILGLSTILMLLLFPRLSLSLSFLLSLLALWGLVLSGRKGAHTSHPLKTRQRTLTPLMAGAAVTLLTAPLIAAVFRTINPEGLADNLIVVPLAGDILLPFGAGELLLHLFHLPPVALITLPLTSLSHAVLGLVHGLARLPGASLSLASPNPLLIAIFYLVTAGILVRTKTSLKEASLPLLAIFLLALAVPSHRHAPSLHPALTRDIHAKLRYDPKQERRNIVSLLPGARLGKDE